MPDLGRLLRRRQAPGPGPVGAPVLSFGSWERLRGGTIAVCHPDWRGVRTAAQAFGDPLVETADPGHHAITIVDAAVRAGVTTVVVHGYPPGADVLLRAAAERGLSTRAVLHSSMAQHGAEAGEAGYADTVIRLAKAGIVDRIGVVKAGLAETLRALGVPAVHTPNRAPQLPTVPLVELGPGALHVGVFGAPYWRKNVVTQLGAAAMLGATAHVLTTPAVEYLGGMRIVEHGELPRDRFLSVQASTALNLYVTLSECHPMAPLESYLSGVPALISRTSEVFRSDPRLWELATTDQPDDPTAIASAAQRLLEQCSEATERALSWIRDADVTAAAAWSEFTGPTG